MRKHVMKRLLGKLAAALAASAFAEEGEPEKARKILAEPGGEPVAPNGR